MTRPRLWSFVIIWTAVALYAIDAMLRGKRKAAPEEAASQIESQ
jgi:EamA domain-containing membrane protein RarD